MDPRVADAKIGFLNRESAVRMRVRAHDNDSMDKDNSSNSSQSFRCITPPVLHTPRIPHKIRVRDIIISG